MERRSDVKDLAETLRQSKGPPPVRFNEPSIPGVNWGRRAGTDLDRLPSVVSSSKSDDWYTPPSEVELVRQVLGTIDLDPASCETANRIVQARHYYTIVDNGLAQKWFGRVFCNPPYGGQAQMFCHRAHHDYYKGLVDEVILLVSANAAGAQWFAPMWEHLVCFRQGRTKFVDANGTPGAPTFNNAYVYMGRNQDRFVEVFSQVGAVVRRVAPGT